MQNFVSEKMFQTEGECFFNTLPTELIVWITDFVQFPDKMAMRSVCDRWRCILDSKFFEFRPIIDGNDSVKNFLKTKTNVMIQNATLENITRADWPYPTRTRNHFPRIHGVTLENGNSEEVLMAFLNRFGRGNLESLRLREYSFLNCGIRKMTSTFRAAAWENLCELELMLNNDDRFFVVVHPRSLFKKYFDSLGRFLEFVTAPKLRKLIFGYHDLETPGCTEELFKPLFPMLHQFISRHSKTLKVLDWTACPDEPVDDTLQGWEVSKEHQETITRELRLESLSTRFTTWGLEERLNLVFPSVWGSTGLKTLSCTLEPRYQWWRLAHEIRVRNNNECVLWKMEGTMRMNKETLRDVSIPLISTIQLNTLNNSQTLRKLTLHTYDVTFNDMNTNLDLRLPTVTHLELTTVISNLPSAFDEWVVRVFRNLESIKLFLELMGGTRHVDQANQAPPFWTISVPTLKKFLLRLPKLKVLNEAQFCWLNNRKYWFDPEVKMFCQGSVVDPVLSYEIIEGRTWPRIALIRVARK